jgi:hypothetical protein
MNTKPMELSLQEKKQIADMEDVRECWGAETPEDFMQLLDDSIYAVKFDFVSGSPGYCGDLITMYGDALQPPLVLIREDGKLRIIELQ